MLLTSALFTLSALQAARAIGPPPGSIRNIVTFGDSYTDVAAMSTGATVWPVYAADYGHWSLTPMAIAGAVCDQTITPRSLFKGVIQDEIPSFVNMTKHGLRVPGEETVYTLWIGTNDVGADEVMTGHETPGATIVNITGCAENWVRMLYEQVGARNFVIQNMLPLNLAPMYLPNAYLSKYWPSPHNTTQWNLFMTQVVAGGNEIWRLALQNLPKSFPGAHIGLFDSHTLFQEMHDNPQNFLNGTAPLNVTGSVRTCPFSDEGVSLGCNLINGTARDSFLWFDELHPSEQADRQVARHLVDGITHKSTQFLTWFS